MNTSSAAQEVEVELPANVEVADDWAPEDVADDVEIVSDGRLVSLEVPGFSVVVAVDCGVER